jgi:acetyl esterase
MPLDPQVQEFLNLLKQLEFPNFSTLSPAQARDFTTKLRGKPLNPVAVAKVENRNISTPAGQIPIRIYTPQLHTTLPALVFFHGGGWLLGDLDACDHTCRVLASQAGCIVVSVDYRLAPEHKFPAAVEDAYAATCWVSENASDLNIDRARIAVGGESAGGNLAAVVTLLARDQGLPALCYQVLIYPVTCYNFETDSYRQHGKGHLNLSTEEMQWFWHHYLATEADGNHPHASPLLAENLAQLPPALIIGAEYDVLFDEAKFYADRLQSAGVPVEFVGYEGMIHSFVGMSLIIDQGKEALAHIAGKLKEVFQSSS